MGFLYIDADLNPSLLGLGLTYIVTLADMVQFCIRQSAELESQVRYFNVSHFFKMT